MLGPGFFDGEKCDRVLFSTYRTEGDDASNLLAQDKAILYVLLAVACASASFLLGLRRAGVLPGPKRLATGPAV